MKKFWFFFPLKYLLKSLGGIPVDTSKRGNRLTDEVVSMFRRRPYVNLAVTPEGTRGPNPHWKTGFLYIAYGANVPVQLGLIDYKRKLIIIKEELELTGDIDLDMRHVKEFYSRRVDTARYPANFKL